LEELVDPGVSAFDGAAPAVAMGMVVFQEKGIGVLVDLADSADIAKAIGLDAVQYQSHS
jgi:hypothetical protein